MTSRLLRFSYLTVRKKCLLWNIALQLGCLNSTRFRSRYQSPNRHVCLASVARRMIDLWSWAWNTGSKRLANRILGWRGWDDHPVIRHTQTASPVMTTSDSVSTNVKTAFTLSFVLVLNIVDWNKSNTRPTSWRGQAKRCYANWNVVTCELWPHFLSQGQVTDTSLTFLDFPYLHTKNRLLSTRSCTVPFSENDVLAFHSWKFIC